MAFSILGSIKKKDMGVLVKLQRSSKPEKKWIVTFVRESGRKKTMDGYVRTFRVIKTYSVERGIWRDTGIERIGEQAV